MSGLQALLPRSPEAPAQARAWVVEHGTTLNARQRQDAALLVSELVTNAVVHGTGTISFRIDVDARGIRVEVADEGDVTVAPTPTPGAHGGWGLRLVDTIADEWGVLEGSTRVWFRLHHQPSDAGPATA